MNQKSGTVLQNMQSLDASLKNIAAFQKYEKNVAMEKCA